MKTNDDAKLEKYFKTKQGKKLSNEIFAAVVDGMIADGRVDAKGKTRKEVLLEAGMKLKRCIEKNVEFALCATHDEDLLMLARKSVRENSLNCACLYYATWFEHWINYVLSRERFGLSLPERKQMLREVSLGGKFAWLLPALGMRRISEKCLKSIRSVSEARNAFVHFKFDYNQNVDDEDDKRLKGIATEAEKTVKYLQSYQRKHLYYGMKGLGKISKIERWKSKL